MRVSEPAESTALIYLPNAARSGCRRCWKGVTVSKAVKALIVANHFLETDIADSRNRRLGVDRLLPCWI